MSQRRLPESSSELRGLLRSILDRLERQERGADRAGQTSFGTTITVGGIELIPVDNGDGTMTLRVRNPGNGAFYDIDL